MRHFKQILLLICFLFSTIVIKAQDKYASPNGLSTNTGTISSPWDLQTGLNSILPGETLWLRNGQYDGRFHTMDNSTTPTINDPVTISSYPGEWAVLNGNVLGCSYDPNTSSYPYDPCSAVLVMNKPYMYFKNFEITYLGNFTRDTQDSNYMGCSGISQNTGNGCKFINLIIHELPTNGIGTWNSAGGTEIYGCLIYNNGNEIGSSPGTPHSGTGIYAQNSTDLWKNFSNNVFFNNFKVGAKLWSASPIAPRVDFLKNLDFDDNVIFNSGSPINAVRGRECFIIAGRSEVEGEGIVHDVNVRRNFMYHNLSGGIGIHAEVFRIGTEEVNGSVFYNYAHDINVLDNYFIGRKEGLRLIRVKDLVFKRNYVRSDYVYSVNNTDVYNNVDNSTINTMLSWDFDFNKYFSKNSTNGDLYYLQITGASNGNSGKRTLDQIRGVASDADLNFETTNTTSYAHNQVPNQLGTQKIISVVQNQYKPNRFKIVVYDKDTNDVTVNLSSYNIPLSTPYTIRDAENYFTVLSTNTFQNNEITLELDQAINLDIPDGDYPSKATITPKKSDPQVGVFIVEFDGLVCIPDYVLQNITESGTEQYLASNSITTAGSSTFYVVPQNSIVTHKAGNSINLKAGTHIKSGSTYLAKIEGCNPSNSRIGYVGEKYSNIEESDYDTGNSYELSDIIVSPNPTSNNVNISSSKDMVKLTLSNVFGRDHFEVNLNNNSSKKTSLNLNDLSTGMYFLKITLKTGEIITKQIIKK